MREASVPHGLLRGDQRRRDVLLRRPTGADEAVLVDGTGATAAARVSLLLARCIERFGGEPGELEHARALTLGDREALLLHLRAATFGERIACVFDCPACAGRMNVELLVGELLVGPYEDATETHELALADGRLARFRLPTGADQEAAAELKDADSGARLLLARCVLDPDLVEDAAASEAVAAEMARLDPQAELRLAVVCPACGEPVDALLDAGTLLLDELAGSAGDLFREVHALARNYHWGESEILGLDLTRRRRYLELLVADEAIEGVAL